MLLKLVVASGPFGTARVTVVCSVTVGIDPPFC